MQAGILEPNDGEPDLTRLILADHHLTEEQKHSLISVYLAFRHENEATLDQVEPADEDPGPSDQGPS